MLQELQRHGYSPLTWMESLTDAVLKEHRDARTHSWALVQVSTADTTVSESNLRLKECAMELPAETEMKHRKRRLSAARVRRSR